MKDEATTVAAFFIGAITMFIAITVFFSIAYEIPCEKKHNVFDCKWEYIPKKTEE